MYVTLRGTPKRQGTAPTAADRRLRRSVPGAVVAFGMVSMLTDISSESVAAVLPLYITAVLGMGPLAYGFFDGVYQGVSAAVRILGGWWADSSPAPRGWVRRRPGSRGKAAPPASQSRPLVRSRAGRPLRLGQGQSCTARQRFVTT